MKNSQSSLSSIFQELPKAFSTPEMNIDVDEDKKFKIVKTLLQIPILEMGKRIQLMA